MMKQKVSQENLNLATEIFTYIPEYLDKDFNYAKRKARDLRLETEFLQYYLKELKEKPLASVMSPITIYNNFIQIHFGDN